VRPAWLTGEDEVDYELTTRDEPFKGTVVSRRSKGAQAIDAPLKFAFPHLRIGVMHAAYSIGARIEGGLLVKNSRMAPSTPPPPSNDGFAALTIAST